MISDGCYGKGLPPPLLHGNMDNMDNSRSRRQHAIAISTIDSSASVTYALNHTASWNQFYSQLTPAYTTSWPSSKMLLVLGPRNTRVRQLLSADELLCTVQSHTGNLLAPTKWQQLSEGTAINNWLLMRLGVNKSQMERLYTARQWSSAQSKLVSTL